MDEFAVGVVLHRRGVATRVLEAGEQAVGRVGHAMGFIGRVGDRGEVAVGIQGECGTRWPSGATMAVAWMSRNKQKIQRLFIKLTQSPRITV